MVSVIPVQFSVGAALGENAEDAGMFQKCLFRWTEWFSVKSIVC